MDAMKNYDYRRLVLGKCAYCGKNDISVASKWGCDVCLGRIAENTLKRYHSRTEEQKQRDRERRNKYVKMRKLAGICVICGNKARENRTTCRTCANRRSEHYRRKKYGCANIQTNSAEEMRPMR